MSFALQTNTIMTYYTSHSPPAHTPLVFHSSSLFPFPHRFKPPPLKKVRSELQAKVNGALDSDSLFLDRQKALEAAMNDINSSFGKGSVTRLGSAGGALVYVSLCFFFLVFRVLAN